MLLKTNFITVCHHATKYLLRLCLLAVHLLFIRLHASFHIDQTVTWKAINVSRRDDTMTFPKAYMLFMQSWQKMKNYSANSKLVNILQAFAYSQKYFL